MNAVRRLIVFLAALPLLVCSLVPAAFAGDDTPVVTGEHWTKSSDGEKSAFLLGMATIIEIEQEIKNGKNSPECVTLVHSWVKGLCPHSITDVREGLDQWYAAHPDKLGTPVVRVLWDKYVKPELAKE